MSTAVQSPSIPPPPGTGGSIRRRNALVPLPLLPPVPRNAIVTSVKIVHNPTPPSPTSPSSTSTSSASSPEEDQPTSNVNVTIEGKTTSRKRPSSTSPTSPTNFYFAPLTKRPRHSRRRSGSRSPKCTSPPTSPTSPPGNRQYFPPQVVSPESMKPKTIKEEGSEGNKSVAEAAVRRPRSTILVTVRLASPPAPSVDASNPFDALPPAPPSPSPTASLPPTPTLRHKKPLVGSLTSRKPRLLSIQNRPQHTRDTASPGFARQRVNALSLPSASVLPALPPVPVRPKWNKPRVSSGLVTTSPVVAHFDESTTSMDIDASSTPISPAGILRNSSALNLTPLRPRTSAVTAATSGKKSKKSKTASRIGMLRWAVLNHSGPEIGRRIQAMGVRLAREIWEAERFVDEEENGDGSVMLSRGRRGMQGGVIVASPVGEENMECAKEDGESVLPCIEEDEMPAIEHVLEHLGLASDEEEKERIAEECIRLLEEEMDEDEEMVDPSIADVVSGNGDVDEGRALVVEVDERPKAETSIKEEDVEMIDVKEEAKPSGILTSGRRASLATEKFNQDKLVELNGNMSRRRSSLGLSEDKMPIIVAARKWFGKSAL